MTRYGTSKLISGSTANSADVSAENVKAVVSIRVGATDAFAGLVGHAYIKARGLGNATPAADGRLQTTRGERPRLIPPPGSNQCRKIWKCSCIANCRQSSHMREKSSQPCCRRWHLNKNAAPTQQLMRLAFHAKG